MRVRQGLQKLGTYKNTAVLVDWDYLLKDRGFKKEVEDTQKVIGMFLRLSTLFGIAIITFLEITLGNVILIESIRVDREIEVVFWILVGLFIYSLYLLRDRTKFFDTLEIKSLDYLRQMEKEKELPTEIELSDYFDYDILNILDDLIRDTDREFMTKLIFRLLELPKVISLLGRLGLSREGMEAVVHKAYLEINTGKDTWLDRCVFESFVLGLKSNFESIDERVVFIYVCLIPLKEILMEFKVMPNEVEGLLLWAKNDALKKKYRRLWRDKASLKPKNTVNRAYTSRMAITLEQFKRDFTTEVLGGDFELSIARDPELDEMVRLLHQGERGAILLVGEPGVGKTTLIKTLAVRMVVEDVPEQLRDMRLVGFDFNKAYAVSPSIEKFRQKLEAIFREVNAAGNIILVLDDFDQLVNVREEVASEVVNLIVESIDKYHLRILATSTEGGYLESIKPNRALIAMFDVVDIDEPGDEVSAQILIDIIPRLESKYRVSISLDAIRKAVSLSHKYAFDRVLPEKAIDLLEEATVYSKENKLKFVSEADIEKLVSKKVGVNVGAISEDERTKLTTLEEEMHKRVIGQDVAIKSITSAIRRARAGLVGNNRPIASFLFFGPTGVGKTETAKTLAETYYGDEKLMIRLDMSEFQEDENLKRLIGHKEGDDFMGGYLTEAVREKPYSLLLLDEIEKANPKVLDIFLQILDEGKVTDGMGREVDFTNTIIIATSNVASKKLAELIERGVDYNSTYNQIISELRTVFRVEFLNRFDKLIMYKPLLKAEVQQIAGIMMAKTSKKLYEKGIIMDFSHQLLQELAELGYDPVYGARELRRVIQENVEDKIANLTVDGQLTAGKRLRINSLNEFIVSDN